jgi:ParB-like nuclease domain
MNVTTAPDDGVEQIKIALIRRDGGTQPRAMLDRPTVSEYAFELREGAQFPPVVVFYDGSDYWLADGFHRVEAAESISMTQIAAIVRSGTIRDAVLYSVGSNATHGLRRNSTDKRRAVTTLLLDEEWSKWSNNKIAKRCGVSHTFVNNLRSSLETVSSEPRTYVTKHGTTAQMKTVNIGKVKKEETLVNSGESEDANEQYALGKTPAPWAIAPSNQANNVTSELLVEGDRVIVKENNCQTGIVTALPNPDSAIVELDGGKRELIYRRDLVKQCSIGAATRSPSSMTQKAQKEQESRRSGINYQPNGASEYYVRVSDRMWKRLEEYQHSVGAATMEGAIERLFATSEIARPAI